MKKLLGIIAVLIGFSAVAQVAPTADLLRQTFEVKKWIRLPGKTIRGISSDTSVASQSDSLLMTEAGIKKLIYGRGGGVGGSDPSKVNNSDTAAMQALDRAQINRNTDSLVLKKRHKDTVSIATSDYTTLYKNTFNVKYADTVSTIVGRINFTTYYGGVVSAPNLIGGASVAWASNFPTYPQNAIQNSLAINQGVSLGRYPYEGTPRGWGTQYRYNTPSQIPDTVIVGHTGIGANGSNSGNPFIMTIGATSTAFPIGSKIIMVDNYTNTTIDLTANLTVLNNLYAYSYTINTAIIASYRDRWSFFITPLPPKIVTPYYHAINSSGVGSDPLKRSIADTVASGGTVSNYDLKKTSDSLQNNINAKGGVLTFQFVNGYGFTGVVGTPTTIPSLVLQTSVSGIAKGDAGSLVNAVSGTDYVAPAQVLNIPKWDSAYKRIWIIGDTTFRERVNGVIEYTVETVNFNLTTTGSGAATWTPLTNTLNIPVSSGYDYRTAKDTVGLFPKQFDSTIIINMRKDAPGLQFHDKVSGNTASIGLSTPIGGAQDLKLSSPGGRIVLNDAYAVRLPSILETPSGLGLNMAGNGFDVDAAGDVRLRTNVANINVVHGGYNKSTELNSYTGFPLLINAGTTDNGNGQVIIGTNANDGVNKLQVAGGVKAAGYMLSALNVAPASSTAAGTLGEIRITSTYIYICTATNTWVRTALATW